ncbi:MAG: COX15/CtaA family protein [Alphaproteobacteria bacterium]|nr:COX15/CtaA family protein [Alphaproteobacteria bacterium]
MRWIRPFSVGMVVYTLFVILWGAFVRASGSGAGCGAHWPACNGEVLHRPQSIETMIELTHRLTSGLCLPLVIVLVFGAFRAFERGDIVRRLSVASLVFMIFEALVGAAIVLLELTDQNDSMLRAGVMGFHLINTFLLMGCLTTLAWWVRRPAARAGIPLFRGQGIVPWLVLPGVLAMFAVGATGGIAALGDTLFPATTLADGIAQDLDPNAHTLLRLRAFHPLVAMLTAGILLGIGLALSALRRHPLVWKSAALLIVVVVGQVAFGWANLLALAPTWMQLTHLLLAQIVWIALMLLAASALEIGVSER